MTNQEAIAILERKTTIPGDGYTWEQIEEAIDVAVAALKSNQVGSEPLTLDQLREMDGKPAWIVPVNDKDWEPHWSVMKHRRFFADSKTERGKMYFLYEDSYGDRWVAYAYFPAHIDREAWTAEWKEDGMCDHKPCRVRNAEKWKKYKCSKCGYKAGRRTSQKYCPSCGRAMTPEAWSELERKLIK